MNGREPAVLMVQATSGMRGPARNLLALASYLAPRMSLSVAVPDGFLSDAIRAQAPDAEIVRLPRHQSRSTSWAHGAGMLLVSRIGEKSPNVIHANGLSALNIAGPVARRLDAPVLVRWHASQVTPRSRALLNFWKGAGLRMAFLPVSNFSRGLLEATAVRHLVGGILPGPIDRVAFAVDRGLPRSPFRVGFMGSKLPLKGLHRVVVMADVLRDEQIEWDVYGIDVGRNVTPYVEKCQAEIARRGLEGNFRWRGKVEDTRAAYEGMDAIVLPSGRENLPRVALEAMASGLPVVASRVGGVSEAVWDGVSGRLFDPQRPEEGAAHLRSLIHDVALWKALSDGALRAVARFDVAEVGRMVERWYVDLVTNGSGHIGGASGRPLAGADSLEGSIGQGT